MTKLKLPLRYIKETETIIDSADTVICQLEPNQSEETGDMLCTALNSYYAPQPDAERAAQVYANGAVGHMNGLDTALKNHTNTEVHELVRKAHLAGSQHSRGQQGEDKINKK